MLLFWVKYILGKGLGILDDFLSVDSSQDLSGWFSFKSILQWSVFRFQPWPEGIAITAFFAFSLMAGDLFDDI